MEQIPKEYLAEKTYEELKEWLSRAIDEMSDKTVQLATIGEQISFKETCPLCGEKIPAHNKICPLRHATAAWTYMQSISETLASMPRKIEFSSGPTT